MNRFSSETEKLLKASGWFEGRAVPHLVETWRLELETSSGFTLSPAAQEVLMEFGGLHIKSRGAGEVCARSDIDLNPLLVKCEEDRFLSFICFKEKQIFPLGEAWSGHTFAAIDQTGIVFLVMMDVFFVADTFDIALENLLLGKGATFIE